MAQLPVELGGPKIRSEGFGEEANLFPIPGIEPRLLDRPARSAVTILTELSRITLEPFDEVIFPYLYLVHKTAVAVSRYRLALFMTLSLFDGIKNDHVKSFTFIWSEWIHFKVFYIITNDSV
jgi:hypothetical protein